MKAPLVLLLLLSYTLLQFCLAEFGLQESVAQENFSFQTIPKTFSVPHEENIKAVNGLKFLIKPVQAIHPVLPIKRSAKPDPPIYILLGLKNVSKKPLFICRYFAPASPKGWLMVDAGVIFQISDSKQTQNDFSLLTHPSAPTTELVGPLYPGAMFVTAVDIRHYYSLLQRSTPAKYSISATYANYQTLFHKMDGNKVLPQAVKLNPWVGKLTSNTITIHTQ